MGCTLPPLEYYGLAWSARVGSWGGVVMTTRLLRGVGTARAKGEGERACDELGACVSSGAGVRACERACACGRARQRGGGGTAEYYGLSVAR